MVGYDSDTDDEADYKTTNVILGYASEESSGDEISHIGGRPLWLDPASRPPTSFVRCKNCNRYMSLLLQLNADLQQFFPQDTRRIYVWTCKNRSCARKVGSIKVFREVKKPQARTEIRTQAQPPVPVAPTFDLGNALFGASATPAANQLNPFSPIQQTGQSNINPFSSRTADSPSAVSSTPPPTQPLDATFAEKLNIQDSSTTTTAVAEPWPEDDEFPEPYPFFYLDAAPEELDSEPSAADASASTSKVQIDTEETAGNNNEKDTFESSLDKTFQTFSDVVAQNPEQVLRYEFKGQPLLYAGNDTVSSRFVLPHGKMGAVKGIPRCDRCSAQRVFELQLMPYLISEVEKNEIVGINDGMEWGAIIVATCINNCGDSASVSFREEWVGVQWEERVSSR